MINPASLKAIIYGQVQGVFFRAFVARWAKELGLTGYVRNLPGGVVEIRAEGERKKLEELIRYLNVGPAGARVEKLLTNWSEYTGDYTSFKITY